MILGENDLGAIQCTIQEMMPYTVDKLFLSDCKSSYVGKRALTQSAGPVTITTPFLSQWEAKRGNWNLLLSCKSCQFPTGIRSQACLERKWPVAAQQSEQVQMACQQLSQSLICQGHKTESANGFKDNHSVPVKSSGLWTHFIQFGIQTSLK